VEQQRSQQGHDMADRLGVIKLVRNGFDGHLINANDR
jgi:hypothetical protein